MDVFAELLAQMDAPWKRDAACREHPDLSWFPVTGQSARRQSAICAKCLVRAECLDAGLADAEHGIWGGTTGRERMRMRRTIRLAAA